MNIRDTILSINDLKTERYEIPDWGVDVDIRALTARQRADVNTAATVTSTNDDGVVTTRKDEGIMYPLLIIAAVYDPSTGLPVFTPADRDMIAGKAAGIMEDLAMAICRLSGITPDAIKVIRKNSEPIPSDASPSA